MDTTGKDLGRSLARLVREHVAAELAELEARIVQRMEEREAKTLADAFKGPWMPGHYERGSLVQRDGVWICLEDTDAKPGEGGGWRLLVKSR